MHGLRGRAIVSGVHKTGLTGHVQAIRSGIVRNEAKEASMRNIFLYAGAALNFLLALLHLSFWKTQNWTLELPLLSADNAAIMQVSNIVIIYILLYFSVMSFVIARRSALDGVSKSIVLCIAGFYSIRLFAGYPFFGISAPEVIIWIVCLLIIAAYVSVLFSSGT